MFHDAAPTGHELWFRALRAGGHDRSFPCDAAGHVDLDALDARERLDYLYARSVIGRELAMPTVRCRPVLA